METRVITFASQTAAFKAQRLLGKNGISSKVVRPNPGRTPHGCSWGLEMSVFSVSTAIYLMKNAGLPFGEVI